MARSAASTARQKIAIRKWQRKHRVRLNENLKAWKRKNRVHCSAQRRRYNGLPEPTRVCPDRCELCGSIQSGKISLCLDHDHATGVFRGWLCGKCNTGLGMLGDTAAAVFRALRYLEGII